MRVAIDGAAGAGDPVMLGKKGRFELHFRRRFTLAMKQLRLPPFGVTQRGSGA
jgi:hypothetical protein